jgi:membrane-bound ClpP family serine protease
MTPFFWAALLLLFALALAVAEMFIPSGGVLGVLAVVAAGAGVFVAYYYEGPVTGTIFLCVMVISIPILLGVAVQVWPHTPVGRSVLIALPESSDEVLPDDEERRLLKSLVGKRGVVRSELLPSGRVQIDKGAYDAVSQGVLIEEGRQVQVIGVRMGCLVVRPLEAIEAEIAAPDDPLAQPIENFGLDPLDDPLT